MSNDNAELLACGGYRANVHFKCIAITISPSTYIGIESTRSGEPEVYLSKVLEIVRNHCLYTLLGLTGFPQATEPTIYLYMTFHHTFVLNFFFFLWEFSTMSNHSRTQRIPFIQRPLRFNFLESAKHLQWNRCDKHTLISKSDVDHRWWCTQHALPSVQCASADDVNSARLRYECYHCQQESNDIRTELIRWSLHIVILNDGWSFSIRGDGTVDTYTVYTVSFAITAAQNDDRSDYIYYSLFFLCIRHWHVIIWNSKFNTLLQTNNKDERERERELTLERMWDCENQRFTVCMQWNGDGQQEE